MARVAQEQIQQNDAEAVAAIVQEADIYAESEAAADGSGGQAGLSFNWPAEWQSAAVEIENVRLDLQAVLTDLIGNAHALLQAGGDAGTLRIAVSAGDVAANAAPAADQAEAAPATNADGAISEELINEVLGNVLQELQSDALADLKVELTDLEDGLVAEIRGDTLYVDIDAAGNGWIVDPMRSPQAAGSAESAPTQPAGTIAPQITLLNESPDSRISPAAGDSGEISSGEIDRGSAEIASEADPATPDRNAGSADNGANQTGQSTALAADDTSTQAAAGGNSQAGDTTGSEDDATAIGADAGDNDSGTEQVVGYVLATLRAAETSRTGRADGNRYNAKNSKNDADDATSSGPLDDSQISTSVDKGNQADARAPPEIQGLSDNSESEISDNSSDGLILPPGIGAETANLEADQAFQRLSAGDDDSLADEPLTDEAMPRAPPTEDSMPRGPPQDSGDYLLLDGAPVYDATENPLDQARLDTILQHALQIWTDYGLTSDQQDRLDNISVQLAELDGGILAEARGSEIYIDSNAAGRGWFIDATPDENSEFETIDGALYAQSGSEAAGRIDLLTVLLHEIGHVLGYDHDSGLAVMGDSLGGGTRLTLEGAASVPAGTSVGAAVTSIGGVLDASGDTGPITFTIVGDPDNNGLVDIQVGIGPGALSFADISVIIGTGAGDTLVGDDVINTWLITGADSGSVQADYDQPDQSITSAVLTFSGIANITGGSNIDFFQEIGGGILSGSFVDAADVDLQLFDYFFVSGTIGFELAQGNLSLNDGVTQFLNADYKIITGSGVNGFVGINGPASNTDATGLELTAIDFSLLLFTDDLTGIDYSALSLAGGSAGLVGFDGDFNFTVTSFGVSFNTTSDSANPDDVLDLSGANAITPVAGTPTLDFDSRLFEVSGNLELEIQSFVKLAGGFDITRQNGVSIDDGGAVNASGDLLTISLSGVYLFAGSGNVAFSYTNGVVDGFTIPAGAAGLLVADVSLDLAIFSESAGALTWKAVAASFPGMAVSLVGIDTADITLTVLDLELRFNIAASDGTKLNWSALVSNPPVASDLVGSVFANVDSSLEFKVSGLLQLEIQSFVKAAGNFEITKRSDMIDDGSPLTVPPFMADILTLNLTGLYLFAGTGAGDIVLNAGTVQDIITTGAVGIKVSGANLSLAIVSDQGSTRSWKAIAANFPEGIVSLVGINTGGFSLTVKDLNLLVNVAAADGSKLDWAALVSNPPDAADLVGPEFANLQSVTEISVSGVLQLEVSSLVKAAGNFEIKKQSGLIGDGDNPTADVADFVGDLLTIQLSEVYLFVGVGAGTFLDADNDGIFDGIDTGGAIGVKVEDVSLTLGIANETGGAKRSWTALAASFPTGPELVGLDQEIFNVTLSDLEILYNAAAASDGSRLNWGLLNIKNPAAPLDPGVDIVDFVGIDNTLLLKVTGFAEISIAGLIEVRGGFGFSTATGLAMTLADGTSRTVDATYLGFENITVFAGAGPYFVGNTTDANAPGLVLNGVNLALALFEDSADSSSYYAVSASIQAVVLQGLEFDGPGSFDFSASKYRIEINGGKNAAGQGAAIDFSKLSTGKLSVSTGMQSVDFDFNSALQRIAIENALLVIGDYVHVSGSFSFTREPARTFNLNDATQTELTNSNAYAFGAGNVDIFVGDGPYFVDNRGPDPNNPGQVLNVADGVIDGFDTRDPNAVGLAIENVNFGLLLIKPTVSGFTSHTYIALKATADRVELVGIPDLTLAALGISVELNTVTNSATPDVVVNFSGSGYEFDTGNGKLPIGYDGRLLQASVAGAELQIASNVYIRGELAFEKGDDINLKMSQGPDVLNASSINVGANNLDIFFGVNGPYQVDLNRDGTIDPLTEVNDDAVGLTINQASLALTILTPPTGPIKYIALSASAATAGLIGVDVFQLEANGIAVTLNLASGTGVDANTPVVDFAATYPSEIEALFDPLGDGVVTVGDLRALNAQSLGYSNTVGELYAAGADPSLPVELDEIVRILDEDGDGVLTVFEAQAFLDNTSDSLANLADADDGDGKLDPVGYEVKTGSGSSYLSETQRRIFAAADDVLFNLADFVYVNGGVAFDLGTRETVTINTGIPSELARLVPTELLGIVNSALAGLSVELSVKTDVGLPDTFRDKVNQAIVSVVDLIRDEIFNVSTGIAATLVDDIVAAIVADLEAARANFADGIAGQLNGLTSGLTDTLLDPLLDGDVDNGDAFDGLITTILKLLPDGAVKDLVDKLVNPIRFLIKTGFEQLLQQKLGDTIDRLTTAISTAIETGAGKVGDAIKTEINKVIEAQLARLDFQLENLRLTIDANLAPVFARVLSLANLRIGEDFGFIENVEVDVTSLGIVNATAFVGLPPDGGFKFDQPLAGQFDNATGLLVEQLTVGLAIFSPVSLPTLPSFTAASITADAAAFRIGDGNSDPTDDPLSITAKDILVQLNLGGPLVPGGIFGNAVIDFEVSFPGDDIVNPAIPVGFAVPTGVTNDPIYLDFAGNELIIASVRNATIQISEFVYITGGFAFEKGIIDLVQVTGGVVTDAAETFLSGLGIDTDPALPGFLDIPATGATETRVSFLTIGASDVHAFVGIEGPYWEDNGSGGLQVNNDAVGLVIDDFDFGLALMTPVNPLDFAKYFALKATAAGISLVGIDDVTIQAEQMLVEINQSSPSVFGVPLFPVVDFANTYNIDERKELFNIIAALDVNGNNTQVSPDELLTAFGSDYGQTTPFSSADLLVELLLAGPAPLDTELSQVEVLAQLDPDFRADNETALAALEDNSGLFNPAEAQALFDLIAGGDAIVDQISVDELVIAFGSDLDQTAAVGSAQDLVTLLLEKQAPPDEVLSLTEVLDQLTANFEGINAAIVSDIRAIDSTIGDDDGKFDPIGYEVNTGGDPVYLAMNSPLIRAQGFVELNIFDSVILTGSVAFELGPTQNVILTNGTETEVTTLTIGADNVTAFVGANGPYWTDIDGNGEVTRTSEDDGNGKIDANESNELSSNAAGFNITELDIGIAVMASIADPGVFLAASASVTEFGLVNVPVIDASGAFDINLNVGLGVDGLDPVDFDASFNEQPDLFRFFDIGRDGTVTDDDLNQILAADYTGRAGITTAEQLVALLDAATGPPDGILTVDELLNQLDPAFDTAANQDAIRKLDADLDGKFDIGFEVNTGNSASPAVLTFDQFLISVQLGGQVTVYSDSAKTNPIIRLNGLFLFEVNGNGLGAFVVAGLEFGPDIDSGSKFFDMNALGALVINADGTIAADIDISIAIGAALGGLTLDAGASARLVFNTSLTGTDQTITIPERYVGFLEGTVDLNTSDEGAEAAANGANLTALAGLGSVDGRFSSPNPDDGSLIFTISGTAPNLQSLFPGVGPAVGSSATLGGSGPYFAVAISGKFIVAGDWGLQGRFGLLVSGSVFQLTAEASLLMGPVGSLTAQGDVIITSNGLLARVSLGGTLGSDAIGLKLAQASGVFEINTTGGAGPQEIGGVVVNPGLRVAVNANFDFLGFATGSGTAIVVFESTRFELVLIGDLTIGGIITFDFDAYVGVFSNGVIVDIAVDFDLDGIRGLIDIDVNGRLLLNTTGTTVTTSDTYTGANFDAQGNITGFTQKNFTAVIPANSFKLDLSGQLILLKVFTINGSLDITVEQGYKWTIAISGNVNVFNVFTISVSGFFKSNGAFNIDIDGFVDFTIGGNGIRGTIHLDARFDPSDGIDDVPGLAEGQFNFKASGGVGAFLGGTKLVGASVSLDVSGTLGQSVTISLRVAGEGTVIRFIEGALSWLVSALWGHPVKIELAFNLTLGTIRLPGSLATPAPPPPSLLAGRQDGTQWNDAIGGVLYLNVGDRAGPGGFRNADPNNINENYSVSRLVDGTVRVSAFGEVEDYKNVTRIVGNFGNGNDGVDFINLGNMDVDVDGGIGNDRITYTGTGVAILKGGENNDILRIAGSPVMSQMNGSVVSGSVLYGNNGDDDLYNATGVDIYLFGGNNNDQITGGTGNDSRLDGGFGNDNIIGRTGIDHAFGGPGSDTFTEDVFDLMPGETFDGGGDGNDQLVLVGKDRDVDDSGVIEADEITLQDFRVTIDANNVVSVGSFNTSGVEVGSISVSGVEIVNLTGEGGADKFSSSGALDLGGVETVVMDMGSITSGVSHLPDLAMDSVDITLSDNNDVLGFEPADMGIRAVWQGHLTFAVLMSYAADNDNVDIFTGGGNDTINLGGNDPAASVVGVNGLESVLGIDGGPDSDTLNIDDAADTGNNQGTLTANHISGLGMTSVTYNAIETLNIDLSQGTDTLNIQSTDSSVLTTVKTGMGSASNTINVGSTSPVINGVVDNIDGKLVVLGQSSGDDRLNVDDSADTSNNAGSLTNTRITGLDMAANDTTKGIEYSNIDTLSVNLGKGADTFDVRSTSALTSINTGVGAAVNIVNVGSLISATNGNLDGLDGKLVVNGQSTGFETLNIDDTIDPGNNSGNNNVGTLNSTRLTGLGMAANDAGKGIEYFGFDALDIGLGSAANTLTVVNTHTGTTDIDANNGADIINLRAINGPTTVNGGDGSDTFNVGSAAAGTIGNANNNTGGNLNSIAAVLNINGNDPVGNSDVLNVDDSGDGGSNTGDLSATQITGLGLASAINYGTVETLNIFMGFGTDTFTVASTHTGTTNLYASGGADILNLRTIAGTTTVDGGTGADNFNVGSNAQGDTGDPDNNFGGDVNAINALLTIVGGSSATDRDLLTVDDTADAANNTGILTDVRLTGLGMGSVDQSVVEATLGIVYSELEDLVISLGAGADDFTISSTHSSALVNSTILNTGAGADFVIIDNVSDLLTVNTGNGADKLNVNGTGLNSTTSLNAQGDNDSIHVRANDGKVLIDGGADNDTVYITDVAPTLPGVAPDLPDEPRTEQVGSVDQIDALIAVEGGTGSDTIFIDGSNAPVQGRDAILTLDTLNGMGFSTDGITYSNLQFMTVWMDFGANLMTVNSTHGGTTTIYMAQGEDNVDVNDASGIVNIFGEQDNDIFNVRATALGSTLNLRGQEGIDTFNVSDASPNRPEGDYPVGAGPPASGEFSATVLDAQEVGTINAILGLVDIDGGSDVGSAADQLNIDDSSSTTDKRGTLTANTLRGLTMPAGIDYQNLEDLNLWLGTGSDILFVDSSHTGTTQIYGGDGIGGIADSATGTPNRDDTIAINTIAGITSIFGQGGNDLMLVNVDEDAGGNFVRTHANGIGAELNLTGNGDSDEYVVNLAGAGMATINVHDYGTPDDGVDKLTINGADDPAPGANNDDTFLLRRLFVALLNDSNGPDTNGDIVFDQFERVNYDENINARLVVNGLAGDDEFVADDNSSITTIDGGAGNDSFQIGQIFGTQRDADANVAPGDEFDTTAVIIGIITDPQSGQVIFDPTLFSVGQDQLDAATVAAIQAAIAYQKNDQTLPGYDPTRLSGLPLDGVAYLSDGVSFATTVYGGADNDVFSVYRNIGTLRLEGEAGDDSFIVRAFVTIDVNAEQQAETEISGGSNKDTIQYAINAPVSIDGGDGFDTIIVLGTPFGDDFVVSEEGIFGAGLNVRFENIESATLDTLEGDDRIYVLSTKPGVITTVIGGLGSDLIEIAGDVDPDATIFSDDLAGQAGVIEHALESLDLDFANAGVDGVAVNVVSADGGTLIDLSPTGQPLVVDEKGGFTKYLISLITPLEGDITSMPVYLTVSAGLVSTEDREIGGESILISTSPTGDFSKSLVLTFDNPADLTRTIFVKAVNDTAEEGERLALISHSVNSANEAYEDLPLLDILVNVVDDDRPGIAITEVNADATFGPVGAPDGLTEVLENGFTDQYEIVLTAQPDNGEVVTVTLLSDAQISLSSNTLVFNHTNWNTAQTVTITAADDIVKDGNTLSTIGHSISTSGGIYSAVGGGSVATLDVTVYDDETAGAIIRLTDGSTEVVDGGAGDSYFVRLTNAPAENVTLNTATDGQTVTVPSSVTFTSATWDQWAEITVNADPLFEPSPDPIKVFQTSAQDLSRIQGPLIVEGGVGNSVNQSLQPALVLPGEQNDASASNVLPAPEGENLDVLNIFHSDNTDADVGQLFDRTDVGGTLIANPGIALTGFEMAGDQLSGAAGSEQLFGGGITMADFEVIEVLLGKGDETLTVDNTLDDAISVLHGGGGNDTITINDRGANSALVVYGDTSELRDRYSNNQAAASIHGTSFANDGIDTIDAKGMAEQADGFTGVVIYGGFGNDVITGSQDDDHLAGGEGADSISAEAGNDHVYGDSHFNVDPILFAQDQITPFDGVTQLDLINAMFTVPTDGPGYQDNLNGGSGNDVIFGDHGEIGQIDGTRRIETTGNMILLQTVNLANGDDDTIHGDAGNDFIFGGVGGDTVYGDLGSDLIFGDHGSVVVGTLAVMIDANQIGETNGAGVDNQSANFIYTSDISAAADASAGSDEIYGGSLAVLDTDSGKNIILGQQGSDTIYGGGGDDDIYGGHNLADGSDTDDFIDGAAGNDVILGDNGLIERTSVATDPRFTVLTGSLIYDENDVAQVADGNGIGVNPANVEPRRILLFDHDNDAIANLGNYGNDSIAGGADDDLIFGQLGNDMLHGDGKLVGTNLDYLTVAETIAGADVGGDDYIEGNGGSDTILGGFGQDDLIGGSSSLYGLTSPGMRPDGDDTILGSNNRLVTRNDFGNLAVEEAGTDIGAADVHARDSDTILGDNGNILRLVGTGGADSGSLLNFNYDNYSDLRIVVRAVHLLDYTLGGPDFNQTSAANDIGGADTIRGESGDDFIYGMVGNDILFGDAQDDDLIGGWGHDWISGGTGEDGVLGDDGRIYTSRNSDLFGEPLYGIDPVLAGELNLEIRTPGDFQQAIINVGGELKKSVNLTPFNVDPAGLQDPLYDPMQADDIIYGGLGDDFLHGGPGDDAISGAEALEQFYNVPGNNENGDVLLYGSVKGGEFAAYYEFDPWRKVLVDDNGVFTLDPNGNEFLLNFDAFDAGAPLTGETDPFGNAVQTDGNDRIFGDLGNDWLVGGTGEDNLYGGYGDDLLNIDDYHESTANTADPNANNVPDGPVASYEDLAFGGAGRDILIANTGGDREVDWAGEFNSYIVPFAPFGLGTVSRAVQPQLFQFLLDLSASDGADPTRAADTGNDATRNGEPDGELGMVIQKDDAWQDQTGAPADPQPGNIPGGARDVLRGADFNNGQAQGFAPDSGTWAIETGRLSVAPEQLGGEAVSVFYVDSMLPSYFEIEATINAAKPTAGWKSNAYLIFDYQSETDFKFAGVNISTDKIEMGYRDAAGWHVMVDTPSQLKPDRDYDLLLAINGTTVTLVVNDSAVFNHVYAPRVDVDGWVYGLNYGMVGIGANNAKGRIDNVRVQVLPPETTFEATDDFAGVAELAFVPEGGGWAVNAEVYAGNGAIGGDLATSFIDLGLANGLAAPSILELETRIGTDSISGFVFDRYEGASYKFAAIDAASDQLMIGHYSTKSGWVIDATYTVTNAVTGDGIVAGQDYQLKVTLKGLTVSASLWQVDTPVPNMLATVGHVFNAVSVDGDFGLFSKDGSGSFDDVTVKTDDPVFLGALHAASVADGSTTAAPLDATELAPLIDVAREFWAALGADVSVIDAASFEIVDLPGQLLGRVEGNTVYIDATAAGHGWFVDATPGESSEFDSTDAAGAFIASAGSEAFGRIDLLSVLLHETGHLLGLDHHAGHVMTASLETGTRLIDADVSATDTQLADAALSLLLQADSYSLIDSASADDEDQSAPSDLPDSNPDPFTSTPPGNGKGKN